MDLVSRADKNTLQNFCLLIGSVLKIAGPFFVFCSTSCVDENDVIWSGYAFWATTNDYFVDLSDKTFWHILQIFHQLFTPFYILEMH